MFYTVSAFTCLSCVRHTYDKEDDVLKNIIQGALNTSDGFSSACGDKDPEVASAECEGNKDTCSTYHLDVGLTVTIAGKYRKCIFTLHAVFSQRVKYAMYVAYFLIRKRCSFEYDMGR